MDGGKRRGTDSVEVGAVTMSYDFPLGTHPHEGRGVGLNRKEMCVTAKYPQLAAAFCFGAEFHLISRSFRLSGGNEDTLWGSKQQQRCACFEVIGSFKTNANHYKIMKRVTLLHEDQ